jgi:hypothetical protein
MLTKLPVTCVDPLTNLPSHGIASAVVLLVVGPHCVSPGTSRELPGSAPVVAGFNALLQALCSAVDCSAHNLFPRFLCATE